MTTLNDTIGKYGDTFIFTATTGAQITGFQSFTIPNKVKMISFLLIGAGGGGGGGSQPTGAASSYSGGGGGGSGSTATLVMPTEYLPETIYINIGIGGNGGARAATTGGTGSSGTNSVIAWYPLYINSQYHIMSCSGGSGGTGGGTGSRAGGAAGSLGSLLLRSSAVMFNSTFGQAGGAGFTSTPTTTESRQALGVNIVGGGAGGGGCTGASAAGFAGAEITGAFQTQTISGGAPEQNGLPGVWNSNYMYGTGGSGGGGSPNLTGTTGNGGDGAYGCGGGGGGSSRNAGNGAGGTGGRGGDGLAIITVW